MSSERGQVNQSTEASSSLISCLGKPKNIAKGLFVAGGAAGVTTVGATFGGGYQAAIAAGALTLLACGCGATTYCVSAYQHRTQPDPEQQMEQQHSSRHRSRSDHRSRQRSRLHDRENAEVSR